jgi:hypothetical protein
LDVLEALAAGPLLERFFSDLVVLEGLSELSLSVDEGWPLRA